MINQGNSSPRRLKQYVRSVLIGILSPLMVAAVARAELNDTGVAACFSDRSAAACSGTGQDGEYGRDVERPNSSDGPFGFQFLKVCNNGKPAGSATCPKNPEPGLEKNNWGCTYDRVSGKLWELKSNIPGSIHNAWASFTFTEALDDPHPPGALSSGDGNTYYTAGELRNFVAAVNSESLCGRRDWRVTSIAEIQSIFNYGALPLNGLQSPWFPNTKDYPHWVSTPYLGPLMGGNPSAMEFNPLFGNTGAHCKCQANLAVLVAGPTEDLQSPVRFKPSRDGAEVLDRMTNLVWRRCMEGMSWTGTKCLGNPLFADWHAATSSTRQSQGLVWRIPNIKELSSILDYSQSPVRFYPLLSSTAVVGTVWSSTPIYGTGTDAMFVTLDEYAYQGASHVAVARAFRLVRDAK